MMCVFNTPVFAVDEDVTVEHTHECVEHIHNDEMESEVAPRSIDPRCWAGNHDYTGTVNFSGTHIVHDWNNSGVCKIFYYDNVSCSRWLCKYTKDIITNEGTINCSLH